MVINGGDTAVSGGVGYNANNTTGAGYKAKKSVVVCEHCGCKGHSMNQCYKIVEYPADFQSKRKPMYANQVDLGQEVRGTNNQNNAVTLAGSHPSAFFTTVAAVQTWS